jgi:hypothetical protein
LIELTLLIIWERLREMNSIVNIIIIFIENFRQKDWKKAYVILKTPVPEFF